MPTVILTVPDFKLTSSFKAVTNFENVNDLKQYYTTPTTPSVVKEFITSKIPKNATNISATASYSAGGSKYGGETWQNNSKDNPLSISITPGGVVAVTYKFKSSTTGALYPAGVPGTVASQQRSGTVSFSNIKIEVSYSEEATKCEPPSSIFISPSALAPGGESILSWAKASPGSGNPISGYQIYRATSKEGPYSLLGGKIESTSASGSIPIVASATDGESYFYKIVTVGTIEGLNSDQSNAAEQRSDNDIQPIPNIFSIYADGEILYSSINMAGALVLSPTCSVEIGKAGSLDFLLLPGHPLYSKLKKLKSVVTAYMGDDEIFNGRVLNWEKDFYNQKKVHCEGCLSYLLDTLQPPRKVKMTISEYFEHIIAEHNLQVGVDKKFTKGLVDSGFTTLEIDFENSTYRDTKEAIDSDLIKEYGGFLRTRTVEEYIYLDYIKDYNTLSTQKLEFGSNILDLSENVSTTEIFTVLLPVGANVEALSNSGGPSWPLTIESVNGGSKLIENLAGIEKYGRIVHTQEFGWITDPAELKAKAEEYMTHAYFDPESTFSIRAIDLNFYNSELSHFSIGSKFQVISPPHGLDTTLTCLAIAYDLENIENTKLTIGPKPLDLGSRFNGEKGLSTAMGSVSGGNDGGTVGKTQKLLKSVKAIIDNAEIGTARIKDAAITNAKIGNAEITSAKIGTAEIKTANIDDAAITSAKIGTAEIKTANIDDAAITSAKIGTAQIKTANIDDAAITSAKIGTAQIKTANIENAAITSAKIGTAQIKTANIDDAAITSAKIGTAQIKTANIDDAAITRAKIGLAAIGTANIEDASIVSAHIIDGSITNAKIYDLSADKITTGTLDAQRISSGSITAGHIAAGTITGDKIAGLTITGEKIAGQTITGTKIAGQTITGEKIAGQTITGAHVQTGSLNGNLIEGGTITGDLIYAGTLDAKKIKAASIGADQIGANHIAANSIKTEHIEAGQVVASHILAGSITSDKLYSGEVEASKITSAYLYAGEVEAMKILAGNIGASQIDSNHITSGAITGLHIQGNVIEGRHIIGETITGDKIQAETITGGHLGIETIQASNIATGSITADRLVVSAELDAYKISAEHIKTGGITANSIAANTITADSAIIENGAITTAKIGTAAIKEGNIDLLAVQSAHIADAAITTAKIANLAVDGAKIASLAVDTGHIADAAIKSAQIHDAAIVSAKIADANIITAKIADAAITNAKIGNLAVDSLKIADLAVTTAKIANAAITSAKIGLLAVDTANIKDAAIVSAKIGYGEIKRANIGFAAIGSAEIEDGSIVSAKIGNAQITNAHISSAGIDFAKIKSVLISEGMIGSGVINTVHIKAGSITDALIGNLSANKISAGTLSVERLLFTGSENSIIYQLNNIGDLVSTNVSKLDGYVLEDDTVHADKIIAGTISARHIGADQINANHILSGSITVGKLGAGAVQADNIAAGSITVNHLASGFGQALNLSSNDTIRLKVEGMISGKADKTELIGLATEDYVGTQFTTLFEVERTGITTKITEERAYSSSILDQLNEYKESISTWQRFDINGLTIGKSGSPFEMTLDNTEMAFKQDGIVIASVSNRMLKIGSSQLTNQLIIGNDEEGYMTLDVVDGGLVCTWDAQRPPT